MALMGALSGVYDFFLNTDDVRNKILAKNKYAAYSVLVTYVILVKWLIPTMLKNRKPLEFRTIMISYGFLLTLGNAIVAYHGSVLLTNKHFRCGAKNNPDRHLYIKDVYSFIWGVYILKYIELLDTIFFSLRKKYNQITFLHLFHHIFVIYVVLIHFRQDRYGYVSVLAGCINAWIHVVMYFYYGLAAIGPHMQKYLWWKRYLTLMQIMQFVVILAYIAYGYLTGCEELERDDIVLSIFISIVLVLFINFYIKSFKQNSNNGEEKTKIK